MTLQPTEPHQPGSNPFLFCEKNLDGSRPPLAFLGATWHLKEAPLLRNTDFQGPKWPSGLNCACQLLPPAPFTFEQLKDRGHHRPRASLSLRTACLHLQASHTSQFYHPLFPVLELSPFPYFFLCFLKYSWYPTLYWLH